MGLIQIRGLPESAHRVLKSRAAASGRTLSDYLRQEIVEIADRPSADELWARIESRDVIEPRVSPTEIIRRERDARG